MQTRILITSTVFLALGWPATAQMPTVESYVKRLSSIEPSALKESDCSAQISKAERLNAADLFYASAVCQAVDKDVEANFLLSAGQVRGSSDMALMAPAAKADLESSAALYGFIFYHAGGPGNLEVFRAAPARDRFFQLFDSWVPTMDAAYSPGWNVGKRPDHAKYQETTTEIKAGRRQQLVEISRFISDEDYYALQRQFDELQKRTSGRYVEGTPEAKLSSELQRRMAQRARDLGINHENPEVSAESDRNTPPSAPGKDETVIATSTDPVVKQCSAWADNLALMTVSKIVRVVMTTGSEWGLVWRADIADADDPPEMSRFICSQHGTMLQSGDGEWAPLP